MPDSPDSPGKPRKRRHPRFDYRAQAHASAHAAGEGRPSRIPDHPLIPRNPPALLTLPEELDELLAHLRAAGCFAYDSEFIGELTYHPILCLIQVATAERVALIDPMAGLELDPFWELVADPSLEKIVHAGQQDLEPVFRFLNKPPANIFDTQIAAGFAGLSYPSGLSKLVKEVIGVPLGKGFTFTHWDQRPLTNVQLRYAADDVRYLPALRAALTERLAGNGHAAWAREESESLCDPALYLLDPEQDYLRLRGASGLPPQNAAVLRELYAWREDAARAANVPPRSYVRDEVLLDMARRPIKQVSELDRVKGLPRPVEESQGQIIVERTQAGLAVAATHRPAAPLPEETASERFGVDALWTLLQAYCYGQAVDPAVVCSRAEITRLVRHPAAAADDPPRLFRGWRNEFVGRHLESLRSGQARIDLRYAENALRSNIAL